MVTNGVVTVNIHHSFSELWDTLEIRIGLKNYVFHVVDSFAVRVDPETSGHKRHNILSDGEYDEDSEIKYHDYGKTESYRRVLMYIKKYLLKKGSVV